MTLTLVFTAFIVAVYGPWWIALPLVAAAVYHGRHTIIGERAAYDARRRVRP